MIFNKYKEIYFIGIGGSGMSGIAEILHNLGYKVSGSDLNPGSICDYLSDLGVKIYAGHQPDHLGTANVVVISSAVADDNPEVVEANQRGISVIKRAEMLGELMRLKYAIGIAGTHGKTTTTSMLGKILADARLDPTVIVGGIVAGKGSGATLGTGDYMVAEADEYDRSILSMFPTMAVVTNIEQDHMECYNGPDDLENAFLTYMNRVPFYGMVVYNYDDPILARLKDKITRASVNFGLSPEADYQAVDIKTENGRSVFTVFHKTEKLGQIEINLPGRYNVLNALAAVTAAHELEISFDTIAASLTGFRGVSRRFEIKAIVNDIMVVDDYAHHPTELKAMLEMARASYKRRLVVAFQPHLFSRTQKYYKEFAKALKIADVCILTDVFPAREKPVKGVTSELIARYAAENNLGKYKCVGTKENAIPELIKIAQPGDMIITVGAGSITQINPRLIEELNRK
jgi:UDP-N-acetylmuramate--alanine ligase